MAFVTKTWKDRLVEYAGRRKLKNVSTGEEILMDVSRSEGTVSQAGDAFSAANMNNLEQRIKTEFDNVNSSLGGLSFAQDEDGNWGYKVGADAVVPFKSGVGNYIITRFRGADKYSANYIVPETGKALIFFHTAAYNTYATAASNPGFAIYYDGTALTSQFPWKGASIAAGQSGTLNYLGEIDVVKGKTISITCDKVYLGMTDHIGYIVVLY